MGLFPLAGAEGLEPSARGFGEFVTFRFNAGLRDFDTHFDTFDNR